MVQAQDIPLSSEDIYDEANYLISLIRDIIQISRLDEKRVQLPFEDSDLLELAREVAGRLDDLTLQKQITISVSGEKAIISGGRPVTMQ